MGIFDDIRRMRWNKGITLQAMARKIGISLKYLSQIERGKTNPSIGIIKKITSVLGLPSMGLGNEVLSSRNSSQEVAIVRRNMRKMLVFPKSKLESYLLPLDLQRKLEVL